MAEAEMAAPAVAAVGETTFMVAAVHAFRATYYVAPSSGITKAATALSPSYASTAAMALAAAILGIAVAASSATAPETGTAPTLVEHGMHVIETTGTSTATSAALAFSIAAAVSSAAKRSIIVSYFADGCATVSAIHET